MGEAVVAHGIALLHQVAADAGHRTQLDAAIGVHLAEVAADFEEHAGHVVALEDGDYVVGVGLVRTVVEGEDHGLGRQVAAEDFAVAVLHRHRVGFDHAVVAQDRVAAVLLVQVGDVVVPLLALQFNRTGAVEAAEDAGDFLVVGALDFIEGVQVFADALVQLHRRQRGIGADALVQVAQDFAERQAIGVEQLRG